jgi:hypothetical protein
MPALPQTSARTCNQIELEFRSKGRYVAQLPIETLRLSAQPYTEDGDAERLRGGNDDAEEAGAGAAESADDQENAPSAGAAQPAIRYAPCHLSDRSYPCLLSCLRQSAGIR